MWSVLVPFYTFCSLYSTNFVWIISAIRDRTHQAHKINACMYFNVIDLCKRVFESVYKHICIEYGRKSIAFDFILLLLFFPSNLILLLFVMHWVTWKSIKVLLIRTSLHTWCVCQLHLGIEQKKNSIHIKINIAIQS